MAKMTLDELVRQLSLVYGEGLRCVALYGSTARGDDARRAAGHNVLVIVDAIEMEHLRRESAVARSWSEAGNPAPLTLTMSEWRGSADIFPIEYADILSQHRLLHGALPPLAAGVDRGHLRLQLEHEALSKLLRLRHAILAAGTDAKALLAVLDGSARSMVVLLRAAVRLREDVPPGEPGAVLARVGPVLGFDASVFGRVLRHARGEARLDDAQVPGVVAEYLAGAGALARWVDEQGS